MSAMTRTLIESYAYISLFANDEEDEFIRRWYASGFLSVVKLVPEEKKEEISRLVKRHCEALGVSYKELKEDRRQGGDNAWLKPWISKRKVSFRDICDYLGDQSIYGDYTLACSFVHGQDMRAKIEPFAFYSSIYSRLYLMMDYILRVTSLLVPDEEAIQEQAEELRDGLHELGLRYL